VKLLVTAVDELFGTHTVPHQQGALRAGGQLMSSDAVMRARSAA